MSKPTMKLYDYELLIDHYDTMMHAWNIMMNIMSLI